MAEPICMVSIDVVLARLRSNAKKIFASCLTQLFVRAALRTCFYFITLTVIYVTQKVGKINLKNICDSAFGSGIYALSVILSRLRFLLLLLLDRESHHFCILWNGC
jgi:hypothetical protein